MHYLLVLQVHIAVEVNFYTILRYVKKRKKKKKTIACTFLTPVCLVCTVAFLTNFTLLGFHKPIYSVLWREKKESSLYLNDLYL